MRIDHIAIWVRDLEGMKDFYTKYFQATAGTRYHNPTKQFYSYFLSFPGASTRLELMQSPHINKTKGPRGTMQGIAHFAVSVGSKERVDQLTERIRSDHHTIVGNPRTTGDGYYESVILDPEGNRIEITI